MPRSTQPKGANYGRLVMADGTSPTPVDLTIPYDNGDVKITGLKKYLNKTTPVQGRGRLRGLVSGEREFPQIAFSCDLYSTKTDAAPGTAPEFALMQGAYSTNVSTAGGNVDTPTINMRWEVAGIDLGDDDDIKVSLADVHIESIDIEEGEVDKLTFTGTIYGAVSGAIEAAEIPGFTIA